MKLLTLNNSKIMKGTKKGYLTGILHMFPDKDICAHASKGCLASCLNLAGRGVFHTVKTARKRKRELFKNELNKFMGILVNDIRKLKVRAKNKGLIPVVRLNGTSDINYYNVKHCSGKTIFDIYPDVQFYDYTKDVSIKIMDVKDNHHYTFSMSETNESEAIEKLYQGFNVAVVFKTVPSEYRGFRVVNGDNTDLRFLDDKNVIVGLKAKGNAKKDKSGFVK